MHSLSLYKAFVLGLLTAGPLVSGYVVVGNKDVDRRSIGSAPGLAHKTARTPVDVLDELLEARHHTEAQIAAKEAAQAKRGKSKTERNVSIGKKRNTPAPDEFGPWDSEVDEFGSWVDKRDPHHTEAQIAAKEAAAKKQTQGRRSTPAPDEFGPWDSEVDEFGSWVDKRDPHHTEAQIAAKEAAAKKKGQANSKRAPHHTEAQIAAKEAAAKKQTQGRRSTPAPDEFGPWDSEVDEFGSWVDKRAPHHTEAQIAAKQAAGAKKKTN